MEIDQKMGGMFFLFIAARIELAGHGTPHPGAGAFLQGEGVHRGARMVGASDMRIVFKHVLPNVLGPCIVAKTLTIPGYIFLEAFLSFIGLGIGAPRPSWGNMISENYAGLYAVRGQSLGEILIRLVAQQNRTRG